MRRVQGLAHSDTILKFAGASNPTTLKGWHRNNFSFSQRIKRGQSWWTVGLFHMLG
jgi:hypothetical protein